MSWKSNECASDHERPSPLSKAVVVVVFVLVLVGDSMKSLRMVTVIAIQIKWHFGLRLYYCLSRIHLNANGALPPPQWEYRIKENGEKYTYT